MEILVIAAVLALLFLAVRLLYKRFWNRRLTCEINFTEDYAIEGDLSALSEVIVNDKLMPMPVVEIDFHMDRRLLFSDGQNTTVSDQTYRRDVFALSVRQKITRTLPFKCDGRGYFRIDESGLLARDLFLTQKFLTSHPQHTDFYVLPRPVSLEPIEIPFSRIMGAVLSRRKVYDDPFEFAGLREYTRGDPMKYINWKATAHAGEMLVNLHESTLSQRVLIAIDMEGKGVRHISDLNEAAVRIAAALAERLLGLGVEIGLYSNGTNVQTGNLWKLDSVAGAGSMLFLKKQLACLDGGDGLIPVLDTLPGFDEGREEDDLLILVSRNDREELTRDFSELTGKAQGVQIMPGRTRPETLPAYKNVNVLWMEV